MKLLSETGVVSVKAKIILSVFLLNLLFTGWGLVALYRFHRTVKLNDLMTDEYVFAVHHAELLLQSILDLNDAFTRSRIIAKPMDPAVLRSKIKPIFSEIEALKHTQLEPVEGETLENIESGAMLFAGFLEDQNARNVPSDTRGLRRLSFQTDTLLSAVRADIEQFLAINLSRMQGNDVFLKSYYKNSFVIGAGMLVVSLGLTLLISIVLVTTILVPVNRLVQWLNRYKANPEMQIERLVPVRADELGFLTDSFYDLLSEFFQQKERFRQQTLTDELTGLYNYRYFSIYIAQQIANMERHKRHLALAIFDLDHFKHFNDTNGHPMGNVVLKDLAALLRTQIREGDFVARYGGEEFVMVFPETTHNAAVHLCERIRLNVEKTEFAGGRNQPGGRLTISVGLAFYPESAKIPKLLLEKADKALYEAKRKGRNCVIADHAPSH